MKTIPLTVFLAFGAMPMAFGQCTDGSTYRYDSSAVTRPNGNEVDGYGQSQVFGNYRYWWKLYLDSTWSVQNGPTLGHNTGDTADAGVTVSRRYWTTLQSQGPGTYVLNNTHNAWNVYCSYWDNATVSGDQMSILRPARPDYAPGYNTFLFYLGGPTSSGQYSAQTVLAPGNANGASESPSWIISSGSNEISLSCTTNCQNPTATAIQKSAGCQSYDVVLRTTYNGFQSDPFYVFINNPWNNVAANPWVYSVAYNDGYYTYINYNTLSLCASDGPMSTYDVNEQFGTWSLTNSSYNWLHGPATGFRVDASGLWADNVNFWSAPQNCTALPCVPQPYNPGYGPHTLVQYVPQSWFVGSSTPGVGALVQTNTLQRYTDSAWHDAARSPAR
jgi:hypothetical protein